MMYFRVWECRYKLKDQSFCERLSASEQLIGDIRSVPNRNVSEIAHTHTHTHTHTDNMRKYILKCLVVTCLCRVAEIRARLDETGR